MSELASDLELVLRAQTGASSVRVVKPLTPLSGGFDTDVLGCVLSGAPSGLPDELVLRLFRSPDERGRAEVEAAVQNAAAAAGLPVPKVFATSANRLIDGRAFMLMARVRGTSMMEALADPQRLADAPKLLAGTLLGIHALDPSVLHRALAMTGVNPSRFTPDRLLGRIDWFIETARLDDLAGVADWLHRHRREPATARVICHGDLHPGNLMVERGEITGIIDWSNVALAPPEYDVAITRFTLAIGSALVYGRARRADPNPLASGLGDFIGDYQRHRSVETELIDYYTVLRAAHPLTEIAAARQNPELEDHVREGAVWQHPDVLEVVTRTIEHLTGVAVSP